MTYKVGVSVNLGVPINVCLLGAQMQAIGVLGQYSCDPAGNSGFCPSTIPDEVTDAQIQAVVDAHNPGDPATDPAVYFQGQVTIIMEQLASIQSAVVALQTAITDAQATPAYITATARPTQLFSTPSTAAQPTQIFSTP